MLRCRQSSDCRSTGNAFAVRRKNFSRALEIWWRITSGFRFNVEDALTETDIPFHAKKKTGIWFRQFQFNLTFLRAVASGSTASGGRDWGHTGPWAKAVRMPDQWTGGRVGENLKWYMCIHFVPIRSNNKLNAQMSLKKILWQSTSGHSRAHPF